MSVGRPLITSLRELEPEASFAVVLADRPAASLAAFIDVPLEAVLPILLVALLPRHCGNGPKTGPKISFSESQAQITALR